MARAAEVGLAPHICYANAADGILISDFVEPKPFPPDPTPALASAIRTLHSIPEFPRGFNYFDFVDRVAQRFRGAHILADDETDEVFLLYGDLTQRYARGAELVASHNDSKPENIVFDGDRFWFVDWEAACLNDRYMDLAMVANFFARDEAREETLLTSYCGAPPSEDQRARFHLMRQILHMSYATFLMWLGASGGARIDPDVPPATFDDFHDRLLARQIDMMTADARAQYGRIHWERLTRNLRSPRFAEARARMLA